MKVALTITDDEVREAVRAWMSAHGVPVVAVDQLQFYGRTPSTSVQEMVEVRVKVAYEADSLSSHEGRPPPEVAVTIDRATKIR